MSARTILERIFAGAAPVEAPPKPATRPDVKPSRPEQPNPSRRPHPFRRKDIKPGEEPRPKAMLPTSAISPGPSFEAKTVAARLLT
jgi:hypothetical protein